MAACASIRRALVAEARRKEGLDDFGPGRVRGAARRAARRRTPAPGSTTSARASCGGGVVHSLRMRLRAQEWFRRHPEIADEVVVDPVVVVGMMRSGTTLVQRLLAADPRFRCAHGWEVHRGRAARSTTTATPRTRGSPGPSRARSRPRQCVPDLFAIHPMYALEAEEEIVFLADAFLSHVPESGAHVPAYRAWIDTPGLRAGLRPPAPDAPAPAVAEEAARRDGRAAWVLKTPAHLGYLDDLRRALPRPARRAPAPRPASRRSPSGASLNATLHAMHADTVDLHRIGAEWLERMGWTNDRALATRAAWARRPGRLVTDLQFEDAVADPIGQVARVYDALGLDLTAEAEAAMRDWLERRPREPGRPAYAPRPTGSRRADPRAVQGVRRPLPGSLSIGRTCSSASRVSSPSRARSCGGGASVHTARAANTAPATTSARTAAARSGTAS